MMTSTQNSGHVEFYLNQIAAIEEQINDIESEDIEGSSQLFENIAIVERLRVELGDLHALLEQAQQYEQTNFTELDYDD